MDHSVEVRRNTVFIGRFFGAKGSGAHLEWETPSSSAEGQFSMYPAVILRTTQDSVTIYPSTVSTASTTQTGSSQLLDILRAPLSASSRSSSVLPSNDQTGQTNKQTEPTWFSDVCQAVEMLGDFACGRTPLNLMMNEFKPELCVAETIILQVRGR